jgi:tetratricopeptide (TPR) repeat protein
LDDVDISARIGRIAIANRKRLCAVIESHAKQLKATMSQSDPSTDNPITAEPTGTDNIEELWEYGDPAASEARFRALLATADGNLHLELLTQIARTYSLRQRFDEAHAMLDAVAQKQPKPGSRAHVRYLLERGRTHNSNNQTELARVLFLQAWEEGQAAQLAGLAVDAAHMVAITLAGTPEALIWNERGLTVARESRDPKARALLPALLNNSAWELHDGQRYEEALVRFEEAATAWRATGRQPQIWLADWSVARCLRSLKRHHDALSLLYAVAGEREAAHAVDGTVFEEIAENLAALGERTAAMPYFARAFEALSQDRWLAEHEPDRLAALKQRSGR